MIGKTISHYKIIDKIGEGGMGVVYRAEDTELKRTVALKFLPRHLLPNEAERARFLQEARAAAALDHPNICTIFEIATVDDESFIAMSYVAGEELGDRIAGGPLPIDDAVNCGLEIADALQEAHTHGVVHRDIKPSNVMINDKGRAILMDFGLAKLHGQTRITQEGTTLGTVAYMSPEQAQGQDVDHRSDTWSLGVMLYEMIAGHPPFRGDHQSAVLYAITNETAPALTSVRSDVPMELERIVNKAMAKDADVRYQHVEDLAVDLKALRRQLRGDSDMSGISAAPPIDTSAATATSTPPAAAKRRWTLPVIGIGVVVVAIVVVLMIRGREEVPPTPVITEPSLVESTTPAVDPNSLAVLPLDNMSGKEENEFFADGMTEELITQLARIRALKVISRTSVMRYKDSDKPLTVIAGELGVGKILEGSIMWAGDRVRITAQLIDGTNDAHLWANSYESDVTDVLGLQRQVAGAVAEEIKLELTPAEKANLASAPVVVAEAHQFYLKGRYQWHRRGPGPLRLALGHFEKAIMIDPNYAAAYAGLAETWVVLPQWDRSIRSKDARKHVRKYAEKALELDSTLAEPWATLAAVAWSAAWDWEAADRGFKKAIEANPNYSSAHMWYGEFLVSQGRVEEAMREVVTAQELDPLSVTACGVGTYASAAAGRPDLVRHFSARYAEIDPLNPGHQLLWVSFARFLEGDKRGSAEAEISYAEWLADSDESRANAALLRTALAKGITAYYQESLRQNLLKRHERYLLPCDIAVNYALLGDTDSVIVWLEKAIEERDHDVVRLAMDPYYDRHRSDPRFQEIIRQINLGDAQDRFMKIRDW